jgi:TetR/AcrR family transcriptional regulator, transcriptional repressor for nem operon
MRYQADHAEQTRALVLSVAAAEIRAHGPNGVSVAGIMKQAGLTHGGFYAHFASKDDLLAQALAEMFATSSVLAKALEIEASGFTRLRYFVRAYVSRAHRDHPEQGCALTTLANDISRASAPVRHAFDTGARRLADHVTAMIPDHVPNRHELGPAFLSEMVGAVALSRAISSPALSDTVLKNARRDLFARIDALEGMTQ